MGKKTSCFFGDGLMIIINNSSEPLCLRSWIKNPVLKHSGLFRVSWSDLSKYLFEKNPKKLSRHGTCFILSNSYSKGVWYLDVYWCYTSQLLHV